MATHSLLLLPGDGIGVETMAEVERLIAFFNKQEQRRQVRRSSAISSAAPPIDKHGVADHRRGDGQGARRPTR